LFTSGIGGWLPGPGTAGVVLSPGRTGAGLIASGCFDVGVGGEVGDLSRLHAVSDNAESAMQVQRMKCFMICLGAEQPIGEF